MARKPNDPAKRRCFITFSNATSRRSSAIGSKTKKKLVKKRSREAVDKEFMEADTKQLNKMENSWCPEFSTISTIHDTQKLVDVREEPVTVGDNLEIFFAASGNIDSRFEVEELKDFCRGNSLADVVAAKGLGGIQRTAWMDDRISGPGLEGSKIAREYKNPLTATGLFQALDKLRFNDEHLPDAARRLVYVTDLSPACIHALVGTASFHQANALRGAISKHLAFQTSITVKISSAGIRTFQLDLHLPFFKLDRSRPPNGSPREANAKPRRRWTDLSFMKLETCELQREDQEPNEVWGIQEAHISCTVAGTDNWRWIGYGFVDTEIDGILADLGLGELKMDQIAAGKLDTTTPIWCAREYWIKIFEIRIDYVRKQWLYLIGKLERGIDLYIEMHSPILSSGSGTTRERAVQTKADFDWAHQATDILSRLHGVLSDTIVAWKSFSSPGEDISHFGDTSADTRLSLRAIRSIFRDLEGDEKRLDVLKSRCTAFSRALELRLQLEVKEAAVENGATSELNIAVFYPIALAAGIFNVQQEALPFRMTFRSFTIVVILLMLIVYTLRLIVKYALRHWPLLDTQLTRVRSRENEISTSTSAPNVVPKIPDSLRAETTPDGRQEQLKDTDNLIGSLDPRSATSSGVSKPLDESMLQSFVEASSQSIKKDLVELLMGEYYQIFDGDESDLAWLCAGSSSIPQSTSRTPAMQSTSSESSSSRNTKRIRTCRDDPEDWEKEEGRKSSRKKPKDSSQIFASQARRRRYACPYNSYTHMEMFS